MNNDKFLKTLFEYHMNYWNPTNFIGGPNAKHHLGRRVTMNDFKLNPFLFDFTYLYTIAICNKDIDPLLRNDIIKSIKNLLDNAYVK